MSIGLTLKQRELLSYIQAYKSEHGRCPSFIEMRDATGAKSKSGIHRLLCALEERGHVHRLPNRARAIELTGASLAEVPLAELFAELERRGYRWPVAA